jgi:Flp pilus assembly protein TadD
VVYLVGMRTSSGTASRILFATLCLAIPLAAQDSSADLRQRAVAAFRAGRLVEAEQALRALIAKPPRDAAALGFLAMVLDNQARYPEAERYYNEAIALTPGSISLLNNLGNHYASAGDLDRARRQFLRVLTLDAAHHNANLQLARIAVERKQGREALEYLAHVPEQSTGVTLLRAEALYWAGQERDADAALETLAKASSGDAPALFALGIVLARIGQFDRAEQMFSQVLGQNPNDADALYNLGLAAARAGHLERSRGALETALKIRPNDIAILTKLGRVYATEENYPRAIPLLSEARKQAPRDPEVLLVLARTLDAAGYFRDAVLAYDDYLALRPNDEAARLDRALDYAEAGRPDEAIAELKRHITRFPKRADGYYRLALVTEQRDLAAALSLLNQALALEPGLVSARYDRGIILHTMARSADAAKDLELAAAAEPDHPGILSELGKVYLELQRPKDAETVLRRAAQSAPDDRGILMHFGRALSDVGKEEESRTVLARLDSLGPEKAAPDRRVSVLGTLDLPPAQRQARFIASLERAVQSKPGDASLRLKLAKALLAAGRREDAAMAVREIEDPDPATRIEIAMLVRRAASAEEALLELDRVSGDERREAFHILRAELLEAAGQRADARREVDGSRAAIQRSPETALRAAVLEFEWGDYAAAVEMADHAAPLQASPLVKAAALDRLGKVAEGAAILHEAESRWPELGRTFLVHGALLGWRGERREAGRMLSAAQALGESAPDLTRCLAKAGDCSAPAQSALLEAVRTGAR